MILYEMLDRTRYFQPVWIYRVNEHDQNFLVFRGTIEESRMDSDVFGVLMDEIDIYYYDRGVLVIKTKYDYYDETQTSKRRWSYSIEIDKDIKNVFGKQISEKS